MSYNINRRTVLGGAAALALTPRIALASNSLPEVTTLRSTAKSWLWLVEDYGTAGGFFAEAGIKVNSNASNRGTNIAALQGGGVDIVLGDPGEALRARAQNLKVRIIAKMVGRYASHVVLKNAVLTERGVTEASPVADKIAALKGLKLGTTGPGAAPDALFRYLASLGGMDPNTDFQLVPIQGGGPGVLAALQQGVIDGFCLSSPTADMAIDREDCDYLFQMVSNPPEQMKEFQYITASAGEETIANRRDVLVRYCQGLALAQKSIAADPEKFKAWAKEYFDGMSPEIYEVAFANNGSIYFDDPVPSEELLAKNIEYINTVNLLMDAEKLPESLTFSNMVEPTIAQDAIKEL
ncbi:ABC transporter substrate-binding protein [Chelativorans sp. Marseille-P2723]|uniref:ABC transporter substrate-binding protein n=1 Tax=Chelativorans sp. Marseille-P2723 TaxID=2709133 RepID=UPI001570EEFB|nr:ABC transporter substrate-binding protein [Chelativorans sp. Marseille-P2723]